MVQGESGILACSPPWFRPTYKPTVKELTWPNGSIATTYSSEVPDELRGPQHHVAWADELAKWRFPQDTWDNLMFGLRLGDHPQAVVTTTPRPIPALKAILSDPLTVTTRGSTYDNAANLAPSFLREILKKYEGTRLGQQELYAQMVEQVEGALWQREQIDRLRVREAPKLRRIVVAIDPAVTSGAESDETGIVVAGLGEDGEGYVLDDLSGQYSPDGWARRAVNVYHSQKADRIVAEVNNGGEMVEFTVRTVDPNVSYKAVHASRGKRTRAEPIAALVEQGKIHHVGLFAELEDQLCTWDASLGDTSPDRLDAYVWAFTELTVSTGAEGFLNYMKGKAKGATDPVLPPAPVSGDDADALVVKHQACRMKGTTRTVVENGRRRCAACGCDLGKSS